jgi:hypothetical protein
MSNLTTIKFYEDTLTAIQEEDGTILVAVRPICDNLGIDYSRQLQTLKKEAWACVGLKPTHDSGGRVQEMACLPMDQVPMWLVHIQPSRVKESLRAKLIVYQKECVKVLSDHFFGRVRREDPILADLVRAVSQLAADVGTLKARNEVPQLPPVPTTPNTLEYNATAADVVRQRINEIAAVWGWKTQKARMAIHSKLCKAMGVRSYLHIPCSELIRTLDVLSNIHREELTRSNNQQIPSWENFGKDLSTGKPPINAEETWSGKN